MGATIGLGKRLRPVPSLKATNETQCVKRVEGKYHHRQRVDYKESPLKGAAAVGATNGLIGLRLFEERAGEGTVAGPLALSVIVSARTGLGGEVTVG